MADKFLKSLTIGGEKMVFLPQIVGEGDGKVWTQSNTESSYSVCYGNGLWVAGSFEDYSGLWFSEDGKTWTHSNIDDWECILTLCYANNTWLAGGWMDGIYYSTDGKIWTLVDDSFPSCYKICYGDNKWVGVGEKTSAYGGLKYSNDGITWKWSPSSALMYGTFNDVHYNGNMWIATTHDIAKGLLYSTDGIAWYESYNCIGDFNNVYYGNGLWVASSEDGIYYSTDGINWIISNITDGNFGPVHYDNNIWVIGEAETATSSVGLYYSTDGKTWTQSNITTCDGLMSIYYNKNIWIAGCESGLYFSIDGMTWTQSNNDDSFYGVYYANSTWVAAGSNGLYYSQDSTPSGKVLKVINGEWAVGTLGEVESDLITWLEFRGNEEFSLSTYNTTANWDGTLYYSTDTENWNTWDGTEISSSGNKLYLRGSGNSVITGELDEDYRWVFSGNDTLEIEAIGRIDNLLDWETVLNGREPEMADYCYQNMFYNCTSLTTAPELPATTLADYCYYAMFHKCTSLTIAPELPATTLASDCYDCMFQECTSLITAPELPATTLAGGCYYYMFQECTSLITAPELPATTLVDYCYGYMFSGCTALTAAPELPATTLAEGCYDCMFYWCTSLTVAPELPATTLVDYCYGYMFSGCTALTTAPELPATTLAYYCYADMFSWCTSLTAAPELPATTLADYCYYNMFFGCAALTTAPELPATTLVDYCYGYMFSGCTALKLYSTPTGTATYAWTAPAKTYTNSMFDDVPLDGSSTVGTPTEGTTYYWDTGKPFEYEIVTWADGTDEQISAMVTAADLGLIDLADYWSVGDERTVSLAAMDATGVGESHSAEDVTMVLMNAGGKELVDATTSGRTECSFVVGLKNCLATTGYMNSSSSNSGGWESCARRIWCNSVFRNAIPSTLRGIFKQHKNVTANGTGSTAVTSTDYFALPSEKEIFGSVTYADSTAEAGLSQFKWYETTSNRVKKLGNSGSAHAWWERAPRSSSSSSFCRVSSGGGASNLGADFAGGLAPFGVI